MKSKKADINAAIDAKRVKYEDLVAFARKRPEDYCHQGVVRLAETARFVSPKEVKELEGENSDWQHGFHSGMLAALRFVSTCHDINIQTAEEWFPELDT